MNNIENSICDAIDILVKQAIDSANFDKTIQATIINCSEPSIGEYLVKYQDSKFYAYASNPDITYNSGALVYLLVPEGDFSNHKTIIGAVKNLGANYNSQITQEDQYNEIGNNCVDISENFSGWSLCSYESPEVQIIYDRKQENNEGLTIDNIGLQKYILENSNTTHIILGATFQTNLPLEQQNSGGNYGVIYRLAFLDKSGIEITRDYIVDVNSMTGNPYRLFSDTEQYGIFEIDRENFVALDKIIIFSGSPSFIQGEEGKKYPKDIFIHNLKITAAEKIPTEELNSYNFTILTPQGTYFNSEVIKDKQLIAQLKEKGKVISDNKALYYYWFEEQGNITSSDIYEYNSYGGKGWKCLNSYTIIPPEIINGVEVSPQTIKWVPASPTLIVKKSDLQIQTKTYKCVAVYNNNILSEEITITNYDALYNIVIENESSNEDTAILKCKVYKRKLDSNNHVIYNEDGTPQEEDISEIQNFHFNWSFKDDTGYYETLTESAQTITVNKSSFNKFRSYKCMAFTLEASGFINYYGTSSYLLTKAIDNLGLYSLHIINGDQLFKYNENGISPCHETLENPQLIPELSFYIYNNQTGQIINADQIAPAYAMWTVPAYHTLIIPIGADKTLYNIDNETGEIIKTPEVKEVILYGDSISYSIESRYNLSYAQNNNIQLSVFYDGHTLLANTSLTFIKEGEAGTNGTDYVCQISPNKDAFKTTEPLYDYTYTPLVLLYNGKIKENLQLNRPWFIGKLWKNGTCIFSNNISGEAIPENEEETSIVTLSWEMVHNNYGGAKESSHYLVDTSSGVIDVNLKESLNNPQVCDILKATFRYNENIYYAFLPISTANLYDESYNIEIKQNSGFRYVTYNSKGENPKYNNETPFALNVYKDNQNISMDCTFSWSILGSTYFKEGWTTTQYLKQGKYSTDAVVGKNEYFVIPEDSYDGYCVTNALYCQINHNETKIGEIHIPIHFSLNQFGLAAINGWDGNSIKLDDENGAILAPQMGAGEKDENNKFTGVVMGSVRESGESQKETGLFAYSKGTRSFFLDANDGSAIFGTPDSGQIIIDPQNYRDDGKRTAIIKSGNFYYNTSIDQITGQPKGTGLEIDLSTPQIRFGSGNFEVDKNGILSCKGATVRGFLDVKTNQGSSVVLTEEKMQVHFIEYLQEVGLVEGKLQYLYDKFGNPIWTNTKISETLIEPGEFSFKGYSYTDPMDENKQYSESSFTFDRKTRKLRLQGELKITTAQGSISFCDNDMNINFYTLYNKDEEDDLEYPYLIGQKKNDFKITPTQFSLKGYEYNKEKNENKVKTKFIYDSNSGTFTLNGTLLVKTQNGTINFSDNNMSLRFHKYIDKGDGVILKKTDFALSPSGFSFVGYGGEEQKNEDIFTDSTTPIINAEGEVIVDTDGAFASQSDILDSEGLTDEQKEYYEKTYQSYSFIESSDYNDSIAPDTIPYEDDDKVIENPTCAESYYENDKRYEWKETSSLKYNSDSGKLRLNGDFTLKNEYGSVTLTDQLLRISFKNPVPGDPSKILNRMCISQTAFYFYGYGNVPYQLSEDGPIQHQWGITSGIAYRNGTLKIIGEINATSGTIGGWKIDASSLTATNGCMKINSDGTISGFKMGGTGGTSSSGQITSESDEEKTVITDGQISFYRMMESSKYSDMKEAFDAEIKTGIAALKSTLQECGYTGTITYNKNTGKLTTSTNSIIAGMTKENATKAINAINKYNEQITRSYKALQKAHALDWEEEGRIFTNDKLAGALRGGLCLSSYEKRPLCFSVGNQLVAEFLPRETANVTTTVEGEEKSSTSEISPAFFTFVSKKKIAETSNSNKNSSENEESSKDKEQSTEPVYKQLYGTQLYKDKITTPNIELQSKDGLVDLLTVNKTVVGALNEINSYPNKISYQENISDSENNFTPSGNISYDRVISEWSHTVYKYEPVEQEETSESGDEDITKKGMATPEYRTNTTIKKEIIKEQRSFILQVKNRGKSTEEVTKIIRQKNPALGWNEDVEIQLSGFNI